MYIKWLAEGGETLFKVDVEREDDGRWIAEIEEVPGALVYGNTREEAVAKVQALVLRILADRLEHGEATPDIGQVFAVSP